MKIWRMFQLLCHQLARATGARDGGMKPRSHFGALLCGPCFAEPQVSWQHFRTCVYGGHWGKESGNTGKILGENIAGGWGGRKSHVYFHINKLSGGDVCWS